MNRSDEDVDPPEPLAELQRPDPRTQRFTPNGLGLSVQLTPEGSARFQKDAVARATIVEAVPEPVRSNFERARKLHRYGVLEYEFFTAARDYVSLVLEGALRVRFVSFYEGQIPVQRGDQEEILTAADFDEVRKHAQGRKLRASDGTLDRLPLSTGALLDWARRERLLTGSRSRVVDRFLSELRNHAAHPVTHSLVMPPDSAGTIRDVAEVINKLWGDDTPGGRLFPAAVWRNPRVVAVDPGGVAASEMRLDQVPAATAEEREWEYRVLLAVDGEDLTRLGRDGIECTHVPGFQTTFYPCSELWKGSWCDLITVINDGTLRPEGDSVDHLDRLFFVRVTDDGLDPARSAEDVIALSGEPTGTWDVVRADSPWDAWVHVRDHSDVRVESDGACSECFARTEARSLSTAEVHTHARNSP